MSGKRGPAPAYDLAALHRVLWSMSDPARHQLNVDRGDLAERLLVNPSRLSRHLTQLADAGLIRRLGRVGNRHQIVIFDPSAGAEPTSTDA